MTADPVPMSKAAAIAIPDEIDRIIMSCLAKNPDTRPSATALAKLLRDAPATKDWTEDDALAWWVEFRKVANVPARSSSPTMTITVDVGHRD